MKDSKRLQGTAEDVELAKEMNKAIEGKHLISGTETVADKKKQKKSVSYALKAFKTHLETLIDNDLLEEGDVLDIKIKIEGATKKYIEKEYGL